ncbi:HD-GYP domain-containing protein [Paenibacillus sp. YYML68]|uniref:HD-GYP domain-containing protein n=1 Tax=Paenibacillus sp. YYML68 TaxID=2909250 RepID=UPI002493CB74|nr:HD-GYP domain-containing protein [Paenibacillus sp. YYML68]
MAMTPVSQLKGGERIADSVLTKFDNVLLPKGKIITEREIEILKAFLISSVQVEGQEVETSNLKDVEIVEQPTGAVPFYESYDKLLQLMRTIFRMAESGGQSLPILEIRTALESLIKSIDSYQILTFSPKGFQLQDYIHHNSIMVSLTAYHLAKWVDMPVKDLMPIALGGLLHDLGSAKVESAILSKPTKLSVAENEEMKKHTVHGYSLLKSVPAINEGVKLCALQHHEREDGTGYPLGVRGDKIHSYSKIVAVADMFHAMTNDRYHKKAISPYLVLEQLQTEAFGKLDPVLVQTFISKVTALQNGTIVKLSDNRIGEIIFSDRAHPTRPWVNIDGSIVNLITERKLYIQEVIKYKG